MQYLTKNHLIPDNLNSGDDYGIWSLYVDSSGLETFVKVLIDPHYCEDLLTISQQS